MSTGLLCVDREAYWSEGESPSVVISCRVSAVVGAGLLTRASSSYIVAPIRCEDMPPSWSQLHRIGAEPVFACLGNRKDAVLNTIRNAVAQPLHVG